MCFPPPLAANSSQLERSAIWAVLALCLATTATGAAPIELPRQTITLPTNAGEPRFVDVDGDGRFDLLAIDPKEKKLVYHHQGPGGFTNVPDQIVSLPLQTAWVSPCDVDAHPGLELLFATASGLSYCRQNAGRFESEPRTLITANQVFTNFDFPILMLLTTNPIGTNLTIPVISAEQAVLYNRNLAYEWRPGTPAALASKQTTWHFNDDEPWSLGSHPARSLRARDAIRAKAEEKSEPEPENDAIRKIIADMKKADRSPPRSARTDINGDGRLDVILWQPTGWLDVKTDIYIFLRGTDGQLPARPNRVQHFRGFPIPAGSTFQTSPVIDLNGDGICELVLWELKTSFMTPGGLVETALSHGVDWSLTIRTFNRDAFSGSPDASLSVTAILPLDDVDEWPICIKGDFNGDGHPDLVVRRSDSRWNIFPSTTDGHWFTSQPALTFDAPRHGFPRIEDLNSDGLADLIWHEPEEFRVSVFTTPSPPSKNRP